MKLTQNDQFEKTAIRFNHLSLSLIICQVFLIKNQLQIHQIAVNCYKLLNLLYFVYFRGEVCCPARRDGGYDQQHLGGEVETELGTRGAARQSPGRAEAPGSSNLLYKVCNIV